MMEFIHPPIHTHTHTYTHTLCDLIDSMVNNFPPRIRQLDSLREALLQQRHLCLQEGLLHGAEIGTPNSNQAMSAMTLSPHGMLSLPGQTVGAPLEVNNFLITVSVSVFLCVYGNEGRGRV